MARYVTTQPTDWDPDTAFRWMSDLRHLAEWDPSITEVEQVEGEGPGVGAEYDVTLHAAGGTRTMRYRIEELDAEARSLLARSDTSVLTSFDRVSVDPAERGGSDVTYDADLVLKGPLKLADPLLKVSFGKLGDKAAAGLHRTLAEPSPAPR
ncbi:MAG: SRPBCC family protein [Iamia sp.]